MLIRRGRIWHYQCRVKGKIWKRSTGETDKRRALQKLPALKAQARSLRECSNERPSHYLAAMTREITRLELDVSRPQAERVGHALTNFARWIGKDMAMAQITTDTLHDYQRHRVHHDGVSRSTMDKEINAIRRLLRLNGHPIDAPARIRADYTRYRRFNDDELILFFAHATDRCRPLWLFLLATGARLAEVLPSTRDTAHTPLLKSEIDFTTGRLALRCAKCKANEAPVTVPKVLPPELLPILRAVAGSHDADTLFPPLHKPSRSFAANLRRAGLRARSPQGKLGVHSFRSTYASKLGEAVGQNAWVVQKAMGHKRITTTQTYVQPEAAVVPISMIHLMGGDTNSRYQPAESGGGGHREVL